MRSGALTLKDMVRNSLVFDWVTILYKRIASYLFSNKFIRKIYVRLKSDCGEFKGFSAEEILKYADENGIVDIDDIRIQIEMVKKQEYVDKHNHTVWFCENEKKWCTYFDDIDNKRGYKLRRRKTEKAIIDLIVEYYKAKELNPFVYEVFNEWNKRCLKLDGIQNTTYHRNITEFNRFFVKGSTISRRRFSAITELDLEDFIIMSIRQNKLTRKGFSNLRSMIRGMFKYAKKRKYTTISISTFFNDLELQKNIFDRTVKNNDEEVFSEQEEVIVKEYLREESSIRSLGIALVFETGLRIGELSGLHKSDVSLDEQLIHVQRTEVNQIDPDTNKRMCYVRNFTKSKAGDRKIFLTDNAVDIIKSILALTDDDSIYLFSEHNSRIRANAFNRKLTRVCTAVNIPDRSMHKIRKTYATKLIDNHVSDSVVMDQMGHADIETTRRFYYRNNKTDESKREQVIRALAG